MPKPSPGRKKSKKKSKPKKSGNQSSSSTPEDVVLNIYEMLEEQKSSTKDAASKTGLEDIVLALQKSFSRVSRESGSFQSDHPDEAVAFVEGPIKFAITMKLSPDGNDRLTYNEQGGLETTIEGVINPDIRYETDSNRGADAE
ncbi:MAG: hypothetical protein AAF711_05560 [Planctomycetota bacterium]